MMYYNADPDHLGFVNYFFSIDLCHERGILAMRLHGDSQYFRNLVETSKLNDINFGAIDTLALQTTQHPNPWRLTILISSLDVATMRGLAPVFKSRIPLMHSTGRLIIVKREWQGGEFVEKVWDDYDNAAGNQGNGNE